MTEEQFKKASAIVSRKDKLNRALDSVESDLKTVKDNCSHSEYDLRGTSLTLYKQDVIIILSAKKSELIAEIEFLEKQLKQI